jgi:hypothetical protein
MQRKHGKSRMLRWGTKLFEAVTSEVFHSSKDGGLESKT